MVLEVANFRMDITMGSANYLSTERAISNNITITLKFTIARVLRNSRGCNTRPLGQKPRSKLSWPAFTLLTPLPVARQINYHFLIDNQLYFAQDFIIVYFMCLFCRIWFYYFIAVAVFYVKL